MLIRDPIYAGACAVAAAIGIMSLTRCLHPPGGAAALTAVAWSAWSGTLTCSAGAGRTVSEVMRAPPCLVTPTTVIDELLPALSGSVFHQALVVDAHSQLVGLITQTDLLAALWRTHVAEQVVGATRRQLLPPEHPREPSRFATPPVASGFVRRPMLARAEFMRRSGGWFRPWPSRGAPGIPRLMTIGNGKTGCPRHPPLPFGVSGWIGSEQDRKLRSRPPTSTSSLRVSRGSGSRCCCRKGRQAIKFWATSCGAPRLTRAV